MARFTLKKLFFSLIFSIKINIKTFIFLTFLCQSRNGSVSLQVETFHRTIPATGLVHCPVDCADWAPQNDKKLFSHFIFIFKILIFFYFYIIKK